MALLRSANILVAQNNSVQVVRMYPTLIVQPDGSTYTARHHEPRRIIRLPLDLRELSKEEREAVLERRKPVKKVKIEEDVSDDFDPKKYLSYIKKRARN